MTTQGFDGLPPQPFVEFWVKGDQAPWQVYTRQGRPSIGILAKQAWQAQIQAAAKEAMAGREPITGPVRLTIRCYRSLPNWAPTGDNARNRARSRWIARHLLMYPDTTNYLKAAEDALQGIIMVNDSQDVEVVASKDYSLGEPYTIIKVETVN